MLPYGTGPECFPWAPKLSIWILHTAGIDWIFHYTSPPPQLLWQDVCGNTRQCYSDSAFNFRNICYQLRHRDVILHTAPPKEVTLSCRPSAMHLRPSSLDSVLHQTERCARKKTGFVVYWTCTLKDIDLILFFEYMGGFKRFAVFLQPIDSNRTTTPFPTHRSLYSVLCLCWTEFQKTLILQANTDNKTYAHTGWRV